MTGAPDSAGDSRVAAGSGVDGAGLVSSKTSVHDGSLPFDFAVSLVPTQCAERRVKRLKRSVWLAGSLHALAQRGFRSLQAWFVTLTYRPGVEWSARHVSDALKRYRRWAARKGVAVRYVWVAELQSRGAVHYHLLFWLPHGVRMPKWDRTYGARAAIWSHGMTNTQPARAGVGYLMKYLSKLGELTIFPKGLRLYGIGGLTQEARSVRAWCNLPEWVKREYGVGEVVRRAGGLCVRATGEILESPYRVVLSGVSLLVKLVREIPERFHCGPWSSLRGAT